MSDVVVAPKQTLFQIAESIGQMFDLLEWASSPEEQEAIEVELRRIIETELAQKVDGLVHFDRSCDLEVAKLQDLSRAIDAKIGTLNNRKMRIRNMTKLVMRNLGTNRLKGDIHSINLRDGVESVDVQDQTKIPGDYWQAKTTMAIDRIAIKNDLKAGIDVPGATLKVGEPILSIR